MFKVKDNFVYCEIFYIINSYKKWPHILFHGTEISLYLFFTFRICYHLLEVKSVQQNELPEVYNLVGYFVHYFSSHADNFFAITFAMLFLYAACMEWLFYFTSTDTLCWLMFQYFILLPLETFEKFQCKTLQSEKVVKSSRMSTVSPKTLYMIIKNGFDSLKVLRQAEKPINSSEKKTFFNFISVKYPNIHKKVFIKTVQTLIIADMFIKTVLFVNCISLLACVTLN